jgi:RHS repeat-associated protein
MIHMIPDGNHTWKDIDSLGDLSTTYLFSNDIDQVLAAATQGSVNLEYYADKIGTIRDSMRSDGTLHGSISYTAFGKVTSNTMADTSNRFYFAGREFTNDSALSFNRTRFLDVQSGRFLSQDVGELNLYSYAKNSPVSFRDPSGQFAEQSSLLQRISGAVSSSVRFLGQCVKTSLICGAIALSLGGNTGIVPKEISKAAAKVCEVVEKRRNPKKLKCKLPSGILGPK